MNKYLIVAASCMIVMGQLASGEVAPEGMMVEFLQGESVCGITDSTPEFGWIVKSPKANDLQVACRILVATDKNMLKNNTAAMREELQAPEGHTISMEFGDKYTLLEVYESAIN